MSQAKLRAQAITNALPSREPRVTLGAFTEAVRDWQKVFQDLPASPRRDSALRAIERILEDPGSDETFGTLWPEDDPKGLAKWAIQNQCSKNKE